MADELKAQVGILLPDESFSRFSPAILMGSVADAINKAIVEVLSDNGIDVIENFGVHLSMIPSVSRMPDAVPDPRVEANFTQLHELRVIFPPVL